jgi:hypothetical protein
VQHDDHSLAGLLQVLEHSLELSDPQRPKAVLAQFEDLVGRAAG